jgi:hypothetical protein
MPKYPEHLRNHTKLHLWAVTVDCGEGGEFSTTVETTNKDVAKRLARKRAQAHCESFGFDFTEPCGEGRFKSIRKVAP